MNVNTQTLACAPVNPDDTQTPSNTGDSGCGGFRVRCGTDIVEVGRVGNALASARRFAARVFTETEREYCEARKAGRFESYAARFAAKESFLKALGVGLFAGAGLTEIEVVNDPATGAPSLNLYGGAARLYERLGGFDAAVSLSHTKRHATATVVLLCRNNSGQ